MTTLLLVNPQASKVDEATVAAVAGALGRPDVVRTEHAGQATEIVRALDPAVDTLVVFSGDGTYNEVLNGLARDVAVGFVPGGGTSVLPRALGLSRNPVAAARAIALGRERRIGLGRANGRRFGFAAGVGFDAELIRAVDRLGRDEHGRRPGDRAFIRAAARLLVQRRFRLPPILEVEGLGRAAFALVANCRPYTYAGRRGLPVAPAASFALGLDVAAPVDVHAWTLPLLGHYAFWGTRPERSRKLLYGHDLDRFRILCDAPTAMQLDGEDVGDVLEVEFEAERDAVRVLV